MRELSEAQWWELMIGPGRVSAFGSEEERRKAWEYWRPRLLAEYETRMDMPGFRPWAWWIYDSGLGDMPNDQVAALRELGELQPWEEETLARWEADAAAGGVAVDAEDGEADAS